MMMYSNEYHVILHQEDTIVEQKGNTNKYFKDSYLDPDNLYTCVALQIYMYSYMAGH